jgi:hypothetical protein
MDIDAEPANDKHPEANREEVENGRSGSDINPRERKTKRPNSVTERSSGP